MASREDVMRVTIHAAHLNTETAETPTATLLLQKVVRTIEQFESRGWQAQLVDQDDIAATITFHRREQPDLTQQPSS